MRAEAAEFPVILGQEDFTGIRVTEDNLCGLATKALEKKRVDPIPKSIIEVCTNNPTWL